ncbi:hypothetical protein AB4Y85_14450 [Microvirga sp. 2YAF29]|uniref:hypothetical protein n=1 Tax=Microvirga sp. 2YAF29 TaxID=3233031 RepID=UPI003F96CEB1
MTNKNIAETIGERIAATELVVEAIAQHGREAELRDLRVLLIGTMSLLTRDPGVEAAVDDLYAAASALVRDEASGAHPVARNLRFLHSALERFTERVPVLLGEEKTDDPMRLRGLDAAYAVQLERSAHVEDEDTSADIRSAA